MEVDTRGLVCPKPVLVVRRCLEELEPGDELTVIGDYPPSMRTIRRTCYRHGYALQDDRATDDGEFRLRIRVTEESSIADGAGGQD